MKKIVALILALVLTMSLAACNGKTAKKGAASGSNLTNEQLEKLAAKD